MPLGTAPGTGRRRASAALATQLLGVVLPDGGRARGRARPATASAPNPLVTATMPTSGPPPAGVRCGPASTLEALGDRRPGRRRSPAPRRSSSHTTMAWRPVSRPGPVRPVRRRRRTRCTARRRRAGRRRPGAARRPTRGGQVERGRAPRRGAAHRRARARSASALELVGAELVALGADARPGDGREREAPRARMALGGGADDAGLAGPASRRGPRRSRPSATRGRRCAQSAPWTARTTSARVGDHGVGLGAGQGVGVVAGADHDDLGAVDLAQPHPRPVDDRGPARPPARPAGPSTARSPSARAVARSSTARPSGSGSCHACTARRARCRRRYFRNDGTSKSSSPSSVVVVAGRRRRRGPARRRRRGHVPRPRPACFAAVPAVEAGGDDGDAHLVAHLVVDDRAEDDVGVGVGDAVDDLGGLVDLEQAEVGLPPAMLSRMPRAPSMEASSSGLEMAARAALSGPAVAASRSRCP